MSSAEVVTRAEKTGNISNRVEIRIRFLKKATMSCRKSPTQNLTKNIHVSKSIEVFNDRNETAKKFKRI